MADPASYRPAPGSIPETPGVYCFRDLHGRVLYVGKAKNLRARLNNYFTDIFALHPRTRTMVTTASSGENPSTCSASFLRKLSGIRSGKYRFW